MNLFSADYASARKAFLAAATAAGAALSSLPLAAAGPQGAPLQIDIAWLGDPQASRLLIHSSGLHGVEGFAGAAVQLRLLSQPPPLATDTALLLVHILNPFGMSWLRRANEHNVDLNRNFVFPGPPPPPLPAYAQLDPFLNPPSPPCRDGYYRQLLTCLLHFGAAPLKAAVAGGQYTFPKGLFYGGAELEEGPRRYENWLRQRLDRPRRLLVLDLHTGLGRAGQESLLHSLAATPAALLSRHLQAPVCSDRQAGRVLGYAVSGGHEQLYARLFPDCPIDFVTHEFGTRPQLRVLKALREENRWHHFGGGGLQHPAKQQLKEAFCLPDPSWQQRISERGCRLVKNGLAFLAGESS